MNDLAEALGKILAGIATQATQHALNTDPQLGARLRALEGRCIEIQCTEPAATWHLRIADAGIVTSPGAAAAPHVLVRGTALDLAGWLAPGGASGRVDITGDETLLLEILAILRDFDPDFESSLHRFVGPDTAAAMLGTAEMGLQALQSLIAGVAQSAQDKAASSFLQQDDLGALLTGIDALRLRVDRLAAKVARHEQTRQATAAK